MSLNQCVLRYRVKDSKRRVVGSPLTEGPECPELSLTSQSTYRVSRTYNSLFVRLGMWGAAGLSIIVNVLSDGTRNGIGSVFCNYFFGMQTLKG